MAGAKTIKSNACPSSQVIFPDLVVLDFEPEVPNSLRVSIRVLEPFMRVMEGPQVRIIMNLKDPSNGCFAWKVWVTG